MQIFGFQITKAQPQSVIENRGGWFPLVRDWFPGAWQQNAVPVNPETVKSFHAVFACMTLIASDIAKLRVKLVAQDSDGIWSETTNPAYSPVLRKPNRFQTRIQFWENWVLSKLSRGNTYVLKQRDNRNVVVALYVLDPNRVKPMVTSDGAVYYELQADNMAGLEQDRLMVPASEVIHDRFNCLFHPLVGVSPIYANGLAATQGLTIQTHSSNMFEGAARPGGSITVPGKITEAQALSLKATWQNEYVGLSNAGKLLVLSDGMQFQGFQGLTMNSTDAQLIEQLKWTGEVVASTFHVPSYKIGVGPMPTYSNIQSLNVEYYSQCLQAHIEAIEVCLDEGLATGERLGTEFDIDNLLRMDSISQMDMLEKSKGKLTVNEMRAKLDRKPTTGGDTVYLQEQDHSLEWLARRDAMPIEPPTPAPAANDDQPSEAEQAAQRAMAKAFLRERVRERVNAST